MSTSSLSVWYQKCLSTRSVQLKLLPENPTSTECYVLRVQFAEFNQAKTGQYRLHVHLFDTKYRQFFGRKFLGALKNVRSNKLEFQTEVFFHSTIHDERIILVIEISQIEQNDEFVVAWTVVPVFLDSHPLTDYASNSNVPIPLKKYQLYNGTPRILHHVKTLDTNPNLVKANGILECILQTHQKMTPALDFIPEFVMISNEHIPGLKMLSGALQLAFPTPADTFTAVLDNVSISFGMHADRIEWLLLELINRDNCFQQNKPPNDQSVEKVQILERRLRIGVHNGFTFVEEPLCLYLASKDEATSGSHSYRRRSRSLSRMTPNIRSEFDTFQVKNAIKLSRLCANEDYAIVFAVDYLVGVQKSEAQISNSRFIMLCWGAWCPYQNNTFTMSDSISVPLVGGPRPNPDEVFCFRSLLRVRENEYEVFSDGRPRIILKFNFALVGSSDSQLLHQILSRTPATSERQITPSPKPDIVVKPKPERIELEEEITKHPTRSYPVVDHILEEPILTPIKSHEILPRRRTFTASDRQREAYAESYHMVEGISTSVSMFPRSVLSYLSRIDFPKILDRNGELPTVVDPISKKPINMDLEHASRLDTSEIVIQIMAILNVKNAYISPAHNISRYFFTLQFYKFSGLTTERLVAHPGEGRSTEPLIFKRIDDNNQVIEQNAYGLMIRLTIDKASLPRNNPDDFVQYLAWNHLYIDVWDADSLIHVGMCVIPLRFLCRQGCEAIQSYVQCPIVQTGLPAEPVVTGLLYLKMANIGYQSNNQMEMYQSRNNAAVISQKLLRLGQGKQESYRIRARPLSAIHESAIQRFLTAQKLDIHQRKEELFTSDNINRLRQWNELKKQQMTSIPKASLKRFIFQEELEAYKLVRNEGKASNLLKAVFKAITVQHTIQPEFGQVEFFEFVLHNTYAQQINCVLDINDSKLRVVTNMDEWKFFKAANGLKTPLERDLFQFEDSGEISIFLNPMETVHIPFKYDPFYVSDRKEATYLLPEPCVIKAIFKRSDNGEPFSILELNVQHQRFCIGNSLRWFHEESTKVCKLIRIQWIRDNRRVLSVRSTDSSVLCSLRNSPNGSQELLATCHSNEAAMVKTFLVSLYADRYHHQLLTVWEISIHSMFKLNIEAIQGQITKIPLYLKAHCDQLVQFFSSSNVLKIMPHQPFVSTPQILSDIKGLLKANFPGQRTILVTAVDVNMRRLLYAWMLNAIICEPNIVKTFEVKIPLTETKIIQRKITFENQYSMPMKYRVHTSNEEIVSPEEEYYDLDPQERATVMLNFYPLLLDKPTVLEVLIFIENAEIAQQEEAYSLKISYFE